MITTFIIMKIKILLFIEKIQILRFQVLTWIQMIQYYKIHNTTYTLIRY